MDEDLVYKLALKEAEGIGGVLFRNLISHVGSAKEVLEASEGKLLKIPGIGKAALSGIKSSRKVLAESEELINSSIRKGYQVISFQDKKYPERFKGLYDAPPVLFYAGSGSLNLPRTVAIVGTRKATDYGKDLTEKIVEELKEYEASIISGLAYGIDITAHKAAIKHRSKTISVMAGGLDHIYPAAHKKYISDIKENGGILSENKNDTKPVAGQFIARNRIIAGLSDAVIIVESANRGGGLVTAEYGNNYHKEVYAVPGNIGQTYSEGPNSLIRLNKARIYTSVKNLAKDLGWNKGASPEKLEAEIAIDLSRFTDDESKVISLLRDKGECMIDNLSFDSNIPLNKLAALLLNLEFQDLVKALPGKKFKLK